MRIKRFLDWQWQDYADNHRDPVNLAIHAIAVPAFVAGMLAVPAALLALRPLWAVAGLALAAASLVLQGVGHKREARAPAPFRSRADFWIRIFAEQFLTFPRFVLSGRWLRRAAPIAGSR